MSYQNAVPQKIYKCEGKHKILQPVGMCVGTFIIIINMLHQKLLNIKAYQNAMTTTKLDSIFFFFFWKAHKSLFHFEGAGGMVNYTPIQELKANFFGTWDKYILN